MYPTGYHKAVPNTGIEPRWGSCGFRRVPRVRCATLGFDVERRWLGRSLDSLERGDQLLSIGRVVERRVAVNVFCLNEVDQRMRKVSHALFPALGS